MPLHSNHCGVLYVQVSVIFECFVLYILVCNEQVQINIILILITWLNELSQPWSPQRNTVKSIYSKTAIELAGRVDGV